MVDWRQIQGRIRKAKAAPDAPAQLAALYERTRDAMVAFELASLHEKSGEHAEAARWYTTAAGRFRRAQWKQKAQEALSRLGAAPADGAAEMPAARDTNGEDGPSAESPADSETFAADDASGEEPATSEAVATPSASDRAADKDGSSDKRRRRGRRGGRRHRRRRERETETAPSSRPKAAASEAEPARDRVAEIPARVAPQAEEVEREPVVEHEPPRARSSEPPPPIGGWSARGRAGEPALASRMARLESDLRRMLAAPLHRLAQAEEAPAGPGVFLVSDEDLTSNYYVEACQTLRVGISILLRGERGSRRTGPSLKSRLADHLGISETAVPKYLKEHCVVRWLQLDEGASHLAHFAVAVLRPVLNE